MSVYLMPWVDFQPKGLKRLKVRDFTDVMPHVWFPLVEFVFKAATTCFFHNDLSQAIETGARSRE
jgi:hypothetical protein